MVSLETFYQILIFVKNFKIEFIPLGVAGFHTVRLTMKANTRDSIIKGAEAVMLYLRYLKIIISLMELMGQQVKRLSSNKFYKITIR